MNKFVLIAVVGCSLGLLMQAVLSEGPFESAVQDKQRNDFPVRDETEINNNAQEGEMNDESAFDDQDEEDEDEVDDEEDLDESKG